MSDWGAFLGEVTTRWTTHAGPDRDMALLADFEFRDDDGKLWPAVAGHVIDGASIPQIFWSTFPGSPFIGEYRRAAALHDSLYIARFEENRAGADRAFYKAMRADGTGWFTASVMYAAVRIFGGAAWSGDAVVYGPKAADDKYREIVDWIRDAGDTVTLDAIDAKCDEARAGFNLGA